MIRVRATGVALLALACVAAQDVPQRPLIPWLGADGEPLPFASDEEVLRFLATAEVVDVEDIPEGITEPVRVLLQAGEVRAHAIFRDVDERETNAEFADGSREPFFRDQALFECAAYELSRLLGLDHVPPVVERTLQRRAGSLQIWIEDAMTEGQRISEGRSDPARERWNRQLATMNVFDLLIGNGDRNRGNMLIDGYWKLWFIDHTRAFRGSARLDLDGVGAIDRRLWNGLRELDEATIASRLGAWLTDRELGGLWRRRDALVEHFARLIAERGEAAVVYDL